MQLKNWLNKKLWEKQKVLQEKDEILFDSAVNIYKHDGTITDCDITKNRDVTELGATWLKYHLSLGNQ